MRAAGEVQPVVAGHPHHQVRLPALGQAELATPHGQRAGRAEISETRALQARLERGVTDLERFLTAYRRYAQGELRLVGDGARVRYHGDFDWPGLAIAGRVLVRGATPWRLGAEDYLAALPAGAGVPLSGAEVPTPWDPDLQPALREHGRAVHEEGVLEVLLADLAT